MKLSYSVESISDLARLREFIATHNPSAAQRIALEIKTAIKQLKQFPEIGLPVHRSTDPEMIRDLYIGKYLVRYLISNKHVFILRVWHGKEEGKDL